MHSPRLEIQIRTEALPEQTSVTDHVYAYAYTVTIRNTGNVAAQVVGRRWLITDATGHQEEVRGLAVVGHQPLLKPGEQFEYSSWTRLATPHGRMEGCFFCITEDAHWFESPIASFLLGQAQALH